MEQERIDYLDIVRSLGIILMIMGHVKFGGHFDYFIHAFHMPIFFIISGYLFAFKHEEELSFKTYLIKKSKSLLIPYVCFYILLILFPIFQGNLEVKYYKHFIYPQKALFGIANSLWFLPALYVSDILFYIFSKYFNKILRFFVIILLFILVAYKRKLFHLNLPFSINAGLAGLILFLIGSYIRNLEVKKHFLNKIFNLNILLNIALIYVTYILIFKNRYINMRIDRYGIKPLFLLNVTLSYICIVNFSKHILLIFKFIKLNFISKFLMYIGKNSVVYLCLNQLCLHLISTIYLANKYFLNHKLLKVLLIIVLITFVSYILNHTKLKFILGKSIRKEKRQSVN